MKKNLLLIVSSLFAIVGFAQTYPTSGDIYLGLKKLNVLGSVLYVAAHPDDENTRLLTYFAKDKLYRTGYLSLTRGDGGQNLIGEEQGIELGLIRTQELLAARRIDGAEQFFTRAFDFGYSKSPEETFTKWKKDEILSDVVWVIRKFQPDIIITRFPVTGGGHGQHTASAILANEAFTAAADPKRFPEQLKYVQPWQAKRILLNGFGANTGDVIRLDAGGYNPILGQSYGEISADSRSQHKSQGFGVARSRGEAMESFVTTGGNAATKDLFEDVDLSWKRVSGGARIEQLINAALGSFDFMQPQKAVTQLVEIYRALNALPQSYWKDQKLKEVKGLIEAASGLWMEAFTNQQYAVQGDSVRINFTLNDRLGTGIKLNGIKIDQFDSSFAADLQANRNLSFTKSFLVPDTKPITQPYWLQHKMEEGYYNVKDQQLIGGADVHPAYEVNYQLTIGGERIAFTKPLRYKFNDQVKGEQYEPVVVLPKYTVEIPKTVNIVRDKDGLVQEFSYVGQRNLRSIDLYNSKSLLIHDTVFLGRGARRNYSGKLDAGAAGNSAKMISFNYYEVPEKVTAKELHAFKYDHIPYINYFTDAVNKFVFLDLKTSGKKIGYIIGAGDKVPDALEQMGYEVTPLTEKELARNNLQQFDAIISGVRAHNTNDWMSKYYDKLMKYVEGGGNYIVQYSQANNLRGGRMGPYNFSVVNRRITDENAPVSFLLPNHQVLNFPNKITQDDFKGWVQERSIYHADRLDPNYEKILRMNDPGEQGEDGALVIAKHGKGYFTYTGLVFFRQLPAGVPGAYRLLANIIALNGKKEF